MPEDARGGLLALASIPLLIASAAHAEDPRDLDFLFTVFLPTHVSRRHFDCSGSRDLLFGGDGDLRYDPALTDLQKTRLRADHLAVLDCVVSGVSVGKKTVDRPSAAELAHNRAELIAKTKRDVAKAGGWKKFKAATVGELRRDLDNAELRTLNPNPAKQTAIAERQGALAKYAASVGDCNDADCLVDAFLALQESDADESSTCHIETQHWFLRFERQGGSNRWVRVEDHSKDSMCGTVTTQTLELSKKRGTERRDWTFTIKWVHTNPQGGAGSLADLCKDDGTETWFSDFRYAQKAKLDCAYIDAF